ncbi:hypothetical protein ACFYMI_26035 [Streptomyces collinus]|uniref:oxidoreductase n=1 Tax=Streptomyces collinus TaxID=42684 RepID=UPI0036C3902D
MTTAELRAALEDFVTAARRAIEAGADGVEIPTAPTATCKAPAERLLELLAA